MWPKARCPQLPTCPAWQAGHGGSIPRAAHPSTGCSTTRLPAASTAPSAPDGVLGQRADDLVARARRGRRRCPRSSASCARRAWPGRSRRSPTGRGRRGPTPRPARRARPARPGAAGRRRRRGPSRTTTRPAPRRSAAATVRTSSVLTGPSPPWAACTSKGPSGSGRCEPPSALAQCSTCQPRRRAMADSRDSGFTATGKPTASSMARSLAESA